MNRDTSQPYSAGNFMGFVTNNFVVIFLIGLFFIAGFLAGSLWTENQFLKNGKGTTVATAPTGGTGTDTAAAPQGPTEDQLKQVPPVTDEDYVRGNRNAEVMLIEYSDFECPFCAAFHPTMVQIAEEFGDQIAWVYRHYPLPFHPNAQKAGEGAECFVAQRGQDAFWQYADRMFEEQDKLGGRLNPDTAKTVAVELGANGDAFQRCLDSGEMAAKVTDHMNTGSAAGVSGTPNTILITKDGQVELIGGAFPYEQVKATIEKYL